MDRQILEKAKALRAARDQAMASLVKMEEKKAQVKPAVYQKVRAEYEAKLADAKKELSAILPPIQSRVQELSRATDEARRKVEELSEASDELSLRHHIGEIADDEHARRSQELVRRQETLRSDSEKAQAELAELQSVLKEDAVPGPAVAAPARPEVAPPPQAVSGKERRTGSMPVPPRASGAFPAHPPGEKPGAPPERPQAPHAPPPASHVAPTPSREQIESVLGDPFADVAEADVGAEEGKAFFTNPILLVRTGEDETSYLLDLGELAIGRSPENDIVLEEDGALAKHAVVRFEQDHYVVASVASDGQLVVNDKPCKRAALADGDRIRIGKSEITFRNVRFDV